jgi:adenine-specific DNA-methyltransferase
MQDPYLNWAGKAEHTSFEVPTVSLHVHEKINAKSIINSATKVTKDYAHGLFGSFEKPALRNALEFYQHKQGWKNRLIAGDSLLVMNSLLNKEAMAGQVQMVYIDPPYGIKYGSNFQPFVGKRDVKDGKDEDLTSEPEQIKAFRDTWELGIHSYLSYLRDRLLLARELLSDTGSCFVQISDENVHLVRNLMDEVFGKNNFVSQISYRVKSPLGVKLIGRTNDFIIVYSKYIEKFKYNQIFVNKIKDDQAEFNMVETNDGHRTTSTDYHNDSTDDQFIKHFTAQNLASSGYTSSCTFEFIYQNKKFLSPNGKSWKTNPIGIERLSKAQRLYPLKKSIRFVYYLDDFSLFEITNNWLDTFAESDKTYVVQTNSKVIERCILMTTDPGDLVLDITCGSGTTAFCAEKWGRRWITCDTSRVALAIARQRLTTAMFDYYTLKDDKLGVDGGFIYKTVPHITLKSIANNEEIDKIWDRRHPDIEKALADLNAALKPSPLNSKGEGAQRAGEGGLKEWEVPFELPKDWPKAAEEPFVRFRRLKREMQAEMDASIAKRADQETLYDKPEIDMKKVRVTGPFTVEAVPAPSVAPLEDAQALEIELDKSLARSGETLRHREWKDELLKTGIRGKQGQKIEFTSIETIPSLRNIHAIASTKEDNPKKVAISFGPEHAPLEQKQVEWAFEEAHKLHPKPSFVVFAAFQFDPEAAKDIDETKSEFSGFQTLKASMNPDMQTDDLKKKRTTNESFWLVGSPDVSIEKISDGKCKVEVHGFDYYDTVKGTIESGGKSRIACWMLDPDYDGRSIMPTQIFFPLADEDTAWAKLKKTLKAELDADLMQAFFGTVSNPFTPGKRIAVKIVDDRGLESLKILETNE